MSRVCWAAIGFLLATLQQAHCEAVPVAEGHCADRPEWKTERIVKNSDDAIRIAFALWHAANPEFKREDEQEWAKSFTATLHDCVWRVAMKPEPPRDYSTFIISIGAVDGRLIEVGVGD
jgi:hypothetical protein